jgi:hypothetical protein
LRPIPVPRVARSLYEQKTFLDSYVKYIELAAGLGLEPRYSPPEGDVLPLDVPAAQDTN